MPRLSPNELCIANLRGEVLPGAVGYMSKEEARNELVRRTGHDFGIDAEKWHKWVRKQPKEAPLKVKSVEELVTIARQAARKLKRIKATRTKDRQ